MKVRRTIALQTINTIGRRIIALFASAVTSDHYNEDRQLCDSDLIGEYNHRTGRLDAGNDPCGWYEED